MSEPYWEPLAAVPASPTISMVTTLPSSGFTDGLEVLLVDSLTAPTYAWHFRYASGIADVFKWVFLGGSPLYKKVQTNETTASTTYVDLATAMSLTVPKAGIYNIKHGASIYVGASHAYGYASVKLGAAATSDNDAAVHRMSVDATESSVMQSVLNATLVDGAVVKQQYRVTGNTGQFARRWLEIEPVRLSSALPI